MKKKKRIKQQQKEMAVLREKAIEDSKIIADLYKTKQELETKLECEQNKVTIYNERSEKLILEKQQKRNQMKNKIKIVLDKLLEYMISGITLTIVSLVLLLFLVMVIKIAINIASGKKLLRCFWDTLNNILIIPIIIMFATMCGVFFLLKKTGMYTEYFSNMILDFSTMATTGIFVGALLLVVVLVTILVVRILSDLVKWIINFRDI